MISKEAIDLIIFFEVSSKELYEKKYRKPVWPGVKSGVTIGIGYDLGYVTKEQFKRDWGQYLSPTDLNKLSEVIGFTGSKAKNKRPDVTIPWNDAYNVFVNSSLPKYEGYTRAKLPNYDKLSPDSKGALVSLVYNRGASFTSEGERFAEMRAIRQHMINQEFDKIPEELRKMKRIWPGVSGLQKRRDMEAALFTKGLNKPVVKEEVKEEMPKTATTKHGLIAALVSFVAVGAVWAWEKIRELFEYVISIF